MSTRKKHSRVYDKVRTANLRDKHYCEACASTQNIQRHHCDYNKPLEVMYLCMKCHLDWHRKFTAIQEGEIREDKIFDPAFADPTRLIEKIVGRLVIYK